MTQNEERKYASLMVKAYEWLMEFHNEHKKFTFVFKRGGEHLFCGRGGKERPEANKFYVNLRPNGSSRDRSSTSGSGHWFELDFFADSGFTRISEVKCSVMSDDSHFRYKKFLQEVFHAEGKMKSISIAGGGSSEDDVKEQLLSWLDEHYDALIEAFEDDPLSPTTFDEKRSKCIKDLCDNGVLQEKDGRLSIPDNARFTLQGEEDEEHDGVEEDQNDPGGGTNIGPRNLIVFGAPGTGKSFELEENRKHQFPKNYERVTFYPTYSYAQFVGCYKPVMGKKVYGGRNGRQADDAKPLSIEDLAQRLKQAYDAASDVEPGQTAATLLFAEQYIDALNAQGKNAAKRVVEKAGLPVTAYTAWLSAGVRAATYKARLQANAATVESEITYKFVPGPFLRVLVKALNNPDENWCLIIEEINRANAAAVFGDVFQLLDRNSDNKSEYSVTTSEDMTKFLEGGEKDGGLSEAGKAKLQELTGSIDQLKIPDNMYIWATMNSADQGVFPMDTAFKRRWEFEYIGIDDGEGKVKDWIVKPSKDGTTVDDKAYKWIKGENENNKWNDIRKFINRLLTISKVNEDKLMGPFFVKAEAVKAEDRGAKKVVSAQQFESKVLMYLWEDAARMCRVKLFKEVNTYSELITKWRAEGPQMFANIMRENPFSADKYLKNFCNELKIDMNVSE